MIHTFVFPWSKAPLSLNYRMHKMQAAKITADIRQLAATVAANIPPLGRCEVELFWVVNDRRKRDEENIVPVLKAMCDGLVDAGIVSDDTPEFMVKRMPAIRFVPRKEQAAHFALTITALGGAS